MYDDCKINALHIKSMHGKTYIYCHLKSFCRRPVSLLPVVWRTRWRVWINILSVWIDTHPLHLLPRDSELKLNCKPDDVRLRVKDLERKRIFTLDEMWVVGLMRRQDGGHLVVVGRMHVFINTVPSQLYLLRITRVNYRGIVSFLVWQYLKWDHANGPETVLNGPRRSRKCTLSSRLEPQQRWNRPASANKQQTAL